MADDAELMIAGGGLNRMLLGVACAGAGLSTIVIDRQDPAAMIGERFDGRTSAIAYGSRLGLAGVGRGPSGPGGDDWRALRRTPLGDRLRLAAGVRRDRAVAGDRGRGRADPRDPDRK